MKSDWRDRMLPIESKRFVEAVGVIHRFIQGPSVGTPGPFVVVS